MPNVPTWVEPAVNAERRQLTTVEHAGDEAQARSHEGDDNRW